MGNKSIKDFQVKLFLDDFNNLGQKFKMKTSRDTKHNFLKVGNMDGT